MPNLRAEAIDAARSRRAPSSLRRPSPAHLPSRVRRQSDKTIGASGARPRLDDHSIIVLSEKLIAKNAKGARDKKTQRQARQIYRSLARLLYENQAFNIASIRQSHFLALVDLLGSVATSYGKSRHDNGRSIAELRAIGAAKPAAERGVQPGTLNRHLTFLGQLLVHIRASAKPSNPASISRCCGEGRPGVVDTSARPWAAN